jgi:branched-chain amino acid transport system ATP-binding protein
MDEPSMGVAPLLAQKIFLAIQQLNSLGMTVVLVEQNAHLALSLANRGYVLETGEIVLEGPTSTLRTDSRVREAYLGE